MWIISAQFREVILSEINMEYDMKITLEYLILSTVCKDSSSSPTFQTKLTPWLLVRKWSIPTEWPPLVDEF
jgi:hypothetical protein